MALTRVSQGIYKDAQGNLVASNDGKTVLRTLRSAGGGKTISTQPVGGAKPVGGNPVSSQPVSSGPNGIPANVGRSTSLIGGTSGAPKSLQDIIGAATGGTINEFNTSANRLRERLDSANQGNLDSVQNRNLSRGFGVSGINDAAINNTNQGSQQAYAYGLSDLADKFEGQRQQGLQTALGAAGQQNSRDLADLASRTDINKQREGQRFQFGQNASDRDLQKLLAELMQKNENFRASMSVGANQSGTVVPKGTNTSTSTGGAQGSKNWGGSSGGTGSYFYKR